MKKIIFFSMVMTLSFISYVNAQNPGDDYAFSSDFIQLQPYNRYTNTINNPSHDIIQARRGQIFEILSKVTINGISGYYIEFWKFSRHGQSGPPKSAALARPAGNFDIGPAYNGAFFFISDVDLKDKATSMFNKKKGVAKLDALVLPIKIRFKNNQPNGNFDFEQSISIGPAISIIRNYGGAFGKSSSEFLFGLNATNISVDSNTVPKVIKSKTSLVGLSPFIGFSYIYSGISFSVLGGIDILTGEAGKTWVYRKSPWFGISIGTSLVSTTDKKQK